MEARTNVQKNKPRHVGIWRGPPRGGVRLPRVALAEEAIIGRGGGNSISVLRGDASAN